MAINVNDAVNDAKSVLVDVVNDAVNKASFSTNSAHPAKACLPPITRMHYAMLRFGTQGIMALTLGLASIAGSGTAQAAGLADLFNSNANQVNQTAQKEFLSVDKAFTVVPIQNGTTLTLSLEITPQHYLYKDKFSLRLPEGVTASPFIFSQTPHSIDDPNFGKVPIFDQNQVMATATLTNTTAKAVVDNAVLTWQGCAKAGLCYPPQRQTLQLTLPASATNAKQDDNKAAAVAAPLPLTQRSVPKRDNGNDKEVDTAKSSDQRSAKKSTVATVTLTVTGSDTANNYNNTGNNNSTNQKVDKNIAALGATSSTEATTNTSSNGQVQVSQTNLETTQDTAQQTLSTDVNTDISTDISTDINSMSNTTSNVATKAMVNGLATPNPNANATGLEPQSTSTRTIQLGNVVNQDPFGLAEHPLLALLLLFIAGLGLSFTACVLPMLPIVSNIIARQHEPTAKKGLILSGSYALGVAFAYGLLGAAIAVFGKSLGIIGWLQNPVVLLGFAAVFTLLALYMLESFSVSIPSKLKQKLHTFSQAGDRYLGSGLGSFLVGMLSALVVSPCVSAPLLGALLAVSTIGNPLLGFAALFMLGLGVSAPLMLLGVSQGNLMPKAGAWMHWIKQGFALMLFAVALLLVERVFISTIMLIGWAIWFAVVAGWAWQWQGRGKQFTRAIACVLAVWSACVLVGAAAGSRDAWQPLAVLSNVEASAKNTLNPSGSPVAASFSASTAAPADIRITSLPSLTPILAQHPKVLVDVTADWCIECRIMDKTLFAQRPHLLQAWQVVKLDITKSNADTQQVLQQLRLVGPPVLLYFVNGELQQQQVGAIDRDTFEQTLASL